VYPESKEGKKRFAMTRAVFSPSSPRPFLLPACNAYEV
jgi:hypothetical protein